jgi:hypothetical protein
MNSGAPEELLVTAGSVYVKWNISVVICDGQTSHGGNRKTFEVRFSVIT